jgi:nitrogen fixation protein FixH
MTAARTWLLAITGLLAGNVLAMVALAVLANDGANQVIPDYYERASHYDDELARSAASRALGWRVALTARDGLLDADVRDAAGRPLVGARVRVTGYQRAHAGAPVDVVLAGAGDHYRGALPRRGWYDLVAQVDAGAARFTQRVVVEAR